MRHNTSDEVIVDYESIKTAIVNLVNKEYGLDLSNDKGLVWDWRSKTRGGEVFRPGAVKITRKQENRARA